MAHTGVRRPPYESALVLIGWADSNWFYFDGWCLSRGIDLARLPFDRFLNLCHFALLTNYDTIVHMVDTEKYATATREIERAITQERPRAGRPPAWWRGDEDASQSGLLAARQLGFNPQVM